MVRLAIAADPTWRPPAGFEYSFDRRYGLIDFEQKLPALQRRAYFLWESLPEEAKQHYVRATVLAGLRYTAEILNLATMTLKLTLPIECAIDEAVKALISQLYGHGASVEVGGELPPRDRVIDLNDADASPPPAPARRAR